jgi:hypothetical protein
MDATNALPVETASGSCGQEEMWRVPRPQGAPRLTATLTFPQERLAPPCQKHARTSWTIWITFQLPLRIGRLLQSLSRMRRHAHRPDARAARDGDPSASVCEVFVMTSKLMTVSSPKLYIATCVKSTTSDHRECSYRSAVAHLGHRADLEATARGMPRSAGSRPTSDRIYILPATAGLTWTVDRLRTEVGYDGVALSIHARAGAGVG